MTPDILFYDGNCPLCRKEMRILGKLKRNSLQLQDLHADNLVVSVPLPPREALMKRLHLLRGKEWIIGLEANVAAWQHTSIGWLWRVLLLPGIKPIAGKIYEVWADRRYAKIQACGQEQSCSR